MWFCRTKGKLCLVHIPFTTPLRCAFFLHFGQILRWSCGCRKVTLGTSYDFLASQKPTTTSCAELKLPRFFPLTLGPYGHLVIPCDDRKMTTRWPCGHLTINVWRFLPGYINIVKTSHDNLAMHLRKRHGDRKVPALTSCDVFGTQILRLPKSCGCRTMILRNVNKLSWPPKKPEIYDYYSPCDDPVECEQGITVFLAKTIASILNQTHSNKQTKSCNYEAHSLRNACSDKIKVEMNVKHNETINMEVCDN